MSEEKKELYPTGEVKKPWQSKTLWANLLMAVASFFPQVSGILTPEVLGTIFMVVNTGLRFVTDKKISIS